MTWILQNGRLLRKVEYTEHCIILVKEKEIKAIAMFTISVVLSVGLDLGDSTKFLCVGALDDREVTTTFGKQLLMILCPFGKREENEQSLDWADSKMIY
jgi:hypothetical protein